MARGWMTATAVAAAVFAAAVPGRAADPDNDGTKAKETSTAIFAGGCFWCEESAFEPIAGVTAVISGYTGGHLADPTYEQVSAGGTGHYESVEVIFDPQQVSYAKLLEVFWHNVDPVDAGGQFCDRGDQYRSAIFYENQEQKRLAEESKAAIERSGRLDKPIATPIIAATPFYPAEDYHQDYYKKNPIRYHYYRAACGRDHRLAQVWGADAGSPSH